VFVADTGNQRIRRIDARGTISTVLGNGVGTSVGEGAPASMYPVDTPLGLACDDVGYVFVTSRTTVRMLLADANGIVDGSGPVRTIYGRPPRTSFPESVTKCLTGVVVIDQTKVRVTDACSGILIEVSRQTTQ
jgi:hypothetical protein